MGHRPGQSGAHVTNEAERGAFVGRSVKVQIDTLRGDENFRGHRVSIEATRLADGRQFNGSQFVDVDENLVRQLVELLDVMLDSVRED